MKNLIIFLGVFLFSQTFFTQKGWNLLGSCEDINISYLNVKLSWKYDKKWYLFSKTTSSYPLFDNVKRGEGFWVLTDSNFLFSNKKVLILPVYFYNIEIWDELSKMSNDAIFIINPSNGAGDSIDVNYKNFLDKLTRKVPVGYIYTKYAKRSVSQVKNDIDKWLKLYPQIKGFFVDEVTNENFNYYLTLSEYIKRKGNFLVILNPGTKPNKEFFQIADIIVVYEGKDIKYEKFCNDFPQKSALIMYDVNKSDMKKLLNSKCRFLYVSDEEKNFYSKLPSYFDEELKGLK